MKTTFLLVSEEEWITRGTYYKEKIATKINGRVITEIIVVPTWVVDCIRAGKIK